MSRYHTGNIQPQLDLEEHNGDAKAKNVSIRGLNAGGTQYNNAIVDDSGALKVTGGGGGGGGTVDQGVAGTDPWLMAIDQTGTNNNVEAACTQVTSPWVVSGTVTTGGLTDTELRATPVPISGTVTIQDGGNTITVDGTVAVSSVGGTVTIQDGGNVITVDGTVAVTQSTSPWVTADNQTLTDNTGFTDGTSKVFPVGYIFDETPGTALTENDVAAGRVDSKRAQVIVIEDATTRGQRLAINSSGEISNAEMETPAALADGQSNPTLARFGAIQLRAKYVDGTLTFDRLPHSYYQNRTGAGTASGAGTTIDMTMGPCRTFGLQVENGTGTTSAWNIDLQGSMDGTSFFSILNQTNATGTAQLSNVGDKCVRFIRSFVNSVTGGGTVRIRILGLRE